MTDSIVSVIIPSWNRAYCLGNALDSLIAQTYPHWEAIVIDDGSADNTAEFIAERYAADPRVRYVRQENAGVAAARNRGLAICTGDYVAFLDSDDVWHPWKLEVQLACFEQFPNLGMIWTDMTAVSADGTVVEQRHLTTMYEAYRHFPSTTDLFDDSCALNRISPVLAKEYPEAQLFTGDIFAEMILGNLVHTSTVLLRRDRAMRVGTFNEAFNPCGEDYDFHLRTCREGLVGFVNVPSILYQVGMEDQITNPASRAHRVSLAQNFLKTIQPVIDENRDRITLDEKTIRGALGYAHRWLGQELLLDGRNSEARPYLRESLAYQANARGAALWCMSCLPPAVFSTVRPLVKSTFNALRMVGVVRKATAAAAMAAMADCDSYIDLVDGLTAVL